MEHSYKSNSGDSTKPGPCSGDPTIPGSRCGDSTKPGSPLDPEIGDTKLGPEKFTLVDWEGPNDPTKPVNWSFTRKWSIVVTTSLCTFMVSFGSGVYSAAISQVQQQLHVSATTARLGISLCVLGFAFGPLIWGPASELYGKTRPLWIGYFGFCLCQIPCALSTDIYMLLVFRLLAGLAGSAMLAILGGMYVDILLHPTERGISTAIFSLGTFCGPAAGPIIGNLLTVKLNWRWTAWITFIGSLVFGALAFSVTGETSEAVILRWKTQRLYKDAQNDQIRAQIKDSNPNLSIFVRKYLTKPVKMFFWEPIVSVLQFEVYEQH